MKRLLTLAVSHALFAVAGFAAGIYMLPILTAPDALSSSEVAAVAAGAEYTGQFQRNLQDSDLLHWGEGTVSVGRNVIALQGKIAPGPDYKLYLSPVFVETEADFARLRPEMARIGDVRTFENFVIPVPDGINPGEYNTAIVWCESFGEFITAAKYR